MDITYDPIKSAKNEAERGLPFDLVRDFDITAAVTRVDNRFDYPETRYQSLGLIGDRVCMVVWAFDGPIVRVISLRKANAREVKHYEQKAQS